MDWPAGDPLLNARHFRPHLDLPQWTVRGRAGDHRITVTVRQPDDRTLAVDYANPDGSPTVCRNTERADAQILWEARRPSGWTVERRWDLAGTAHAEVGGTA